MAVPRLLVAETDNAGAILATYLHGPQLDEPWQMTRGTVRSFYLADGLGSPVLLTNPTGAIVERYTYDPYGMPTIKNGAGVVLTSSAFQNAFLFTGREWDQETGLYYYRARYYSPKLGRFLSYDPLGPLPSPNLYTYVENNPVNLVDPWGLELQPISKSPGFFPGGRTDVPLSPEGGFIPLHPEGSVETTQVPPQEQPGVESADTGEQEQEENGENEDEPTQIKPPEQGSGEVRWDPERQRWVDDKYVYNWDARSHEKRGGGPHWDRGPIEGGRGEWSPDGNTWFPK